MPRIPVDAGDVNGALRLDCQSSTAEDVAVLEGLLAEEVKFANDVNDTLFALEAQRSFHFPKRGCFRKRINDHPF